MHTARIHIRPLRKSNFIVVESVDLLIKREYLGSTIFGPEFMYNMCVCTIYMCVYSLCVQYVGVQYVCVRVCGCVCVCTICVCTIRRNLRIVLYNMCVYNKTRFTYSTVQYVYVRYDEIYV